MSRTSDYVTPSERRTETPVQHAAARATELLRRRLPGESRSAVADAVAALVSILESGDPEARGTLNGADHLVRTAARALSAEILRSWREAKFSTDANEVLRCLTSLQRIEELASSGLDEWEGYESENPLDLVVEFAHDVRSPLTSIVFLSETLRRSGSSALDPVQFRQIGIIYGAAMNLVSLVSDVIDLARGGERLIERRPTQFSIGEVLESVCEIVAPLVEEKKVTIRTVAPPIDVRLGHPVALSRVLLNLVSNALRFTDDGYVEIAAHSINPSCVEFTVRDTGTGFQQQREQTLEWGKKVGSSTRFGFAGSGLGLTICRRLLRAMNSELKYESNPSWGTRFHFRLELPPPDVT